MGERRMMTPEAMARRQAGVKKESNLRENVTALNAGQLQGQREQRRFDPTENELQLKKAQRAEMAEATQETANSELEDISEDELAAENQAENAEASFDEWQDFLISQHELTVDGDFTLPPKLLLEKYPILAQKDLDDISRRQFIKNAPVRRTTALQSAKASALKVFSSGRADTLAPGARFEKRTPGLRPAEDAYEERMQKAA